MLKKTQNILLITGLIFLVMSFPLFGGGQQDTADTGPVSSQNSEPKYGGILRVGTSNPIPYIGYTPGLNSVSFLQYLEIVFDSLTFYDAAGNIIPKLAESWETDADNATITFHLKKGVRFHDGTPFNAEAVKWNIEQYQDKKRTEVADISSIEIIDDYSLVLHLKA